MIDASKTTARKTTGKAMTSTPRRRPKRGAASHAPKNHAPGYSQRLFECIYGNRLDEVKAMVKVEKVDVNIVDDTDPLRPTPLLVACECNHTDVVRVLLKAKPKVDVNVGNAKGRRPIWWTAMHGNAEIASMLMYDGKEDCDCNQLDHESGCTPLYQAILSSAPEVCRLLIKGKADVNLRRLWKTSGETEIAESPLVKAVQVGSYEVCDVLINSMCKLQAKTAAGLTALHYAVGYRRYRIADLLLENRIRVNVRSKNGVTPMVVAIREFLPVMCRKLIEWGSDMDKKFKWDETPLEMAIRTHSEVSAMILVQWGCTIAKERTFWYFKKKDDPPSIFRKAAEEGLLRLMRIMLEVYPYFLYEDWVRNRTLPLALYRQVEFCDWLQAESSQVRSLQALAKASTLKHLGRHSCHRLDQLPLPASMKDFLRLDNHFTEKMIREKKLDDHECPYHCPPQCYRAPQCPYLDFSDSATDED